MTNVPVTIWRNLVTLAMFGILTSCASAERELKAPCGPLPFAASDHDNCGPLKPVNVNPFDSVLEAK